AGFIAEQRLMIALPEQQLCPVEPVLARVEPVAVGGVPPHSLPASPYDKSPYAPAPGATRVLPPLPPATYAPPPPPDNDAEENDGDDDDADALPIPPAPQRPERPAVIQAQRDSGYGRAWPPAWGPRPYAPGYGPTGYGPAPYYYYGR